MTPKLGVQVSGAVGAHRPAKFVVDPLYSRCIVLESGGRKICLIATDLTIITREHSDKIRQWAAEEYGFSPEAVMVHATQSHSAPSLGSFLITDDYELPDEFDWLRGGDVRYNSFAQDRIKEAVRGAVDSMGPVQVAMGSGIEGRMAFNRRAVTRDGKAMMPYMWKPPLGPTQIRYMEGPMDPEVGVICFRGESLRFPAMIVNYSCHPVHVFPKPLISADWPGALSARLSDLYGEACVPMVLNGPCGNINPWPPFDPHYVEDHRRMGGVLADTVEKVLETLEFVEEAPIDWRAKTLKLPLREIDGKQLEAAQRVLKENPQPVWADETQRGVDPQWVMAVGLVELAELRERDLGYDYEIQAFRIGDAAVVGLPGEPFVEGALQIKLASPTFPTYIAHDVNHYAGYLPTKEAFPRGGHEVNTGSWSRLVPEALDTVVEASVELLQDLF
jgi:hypothetical protein